MSGLGELDRPGMPSGADAWDARSREWTAREPEEKEAEPSAERPSANADAPAAARGDTRTARAPEAPGTPSAHRRQPPSRRTPADPVKALMHRHRELCERAVDPLEIAAGLEAHGVTDRTAARFRHRDVFSLAEEMFARASHADHDEDTPPRPAPTPPDEPRTRWPLLTLLPGALGIATVVGLRLTHGRPRLAVAVVGALALSVALRAAIGRGPLGADRTGPAAPAQAPGAGVRTYWLLAYALLGDGLLRAAVDAGPAGFPTVTANGPWPVATAPVLALALSCAPAAWCAHLFTSRARRRRDASRRLEDFAASVRPLLLGTFALYLCALAALLAVCGAALDEPAAPAQALSLGALLLLARLLTTHGFTRAPALVLTATAAAEAAALATAFAGRLPGCGFLATPVEALVQAMGPGAVPALVCTAAALTLLIHATGTLTRASAHPPRAGH
ncbi:hypothetical protein ACYF6T_33660 [Streptomyces sp. 7R007]